MDVRRRKSNIFQDTLCKTLSGGGEVLHTGCIKAKYVQEDTVTTDSIFCLLSSPPDVQFPSVLTAEFSHTIKNMSSGQ